MENLVAIGAGLALRTLIGTLTNNDHRVTSTLIGLWEGIVLSHFLHKNPRNSSDAYLALATRFVVDFIFTSSVVRFVLTGAWAIVGLLLADIAPIVWRNTGLRHMYKTLRKDIKAMRRAVPVWRIENDIRVPNISISSGLFSRSPLSTVVSSTRAAPPTSPAPIPDRRRPSGAPPSQVTSLDINSLTREVLPGPSPAFIPTAVDPISLGTDSHSHRTTLLSNSDEPDPSRFDPILIPDSDQVNVTPPSAPKEQQEQSQDPELSALDISPPVPGVEVIVANVEIVSPTPIASVRTLPTISDIDISTPAHQVPLPSSRPASRVNTSSTTGEWRGNVRALADRVGSDIGPSFGKAYHQRSSSATVFGQGYNHPVDNRPDSTGHQRMDLSSRRRERSALGPSEENWRKGSVEPIRATTEPTLSETEPFIGGFAIQAGRQIPQQSQSGSGNVRAGSVLGLTTSCPQPWPTPPSKPRSATIPPTIKPPTPARLNQPTTSSSHVNSGSPSKAPTPVPPSEATAPKHKSDNASKAPTPVPPSEATVSKLKSDSASKAPTPVPLSDALAPKPKSDSAASDPTSTTNRATDYNPAEPIRPLIGSPSTVRDSIFGLPRRVYASGDFDTGDYGVDDSPPPQYESPVKAHGEGGTGEGEEAVTGGDTEGGRQGNTEGDKKQAITDQNDGEVTPGVRMASEGEQKRGETSQATSGHNEGAGKSTTKMEENVKEKVGENKLDETKVGEGASGDNQGAGNDIREMDKVTKVADESSPDSGGDTQVVDGNTKVAAKDFSSKPAPALLTPEQKQAEVHRIAFLRAEMSRLGASKMGPQQTIPPEIQARVDALEARIAKTDFTAPPDPLPPVPEISAVGMSLMELVDKLTTMIVDLLIERQDADPVCVKVSSTGAKKKQKDVEKAVKEFITKTGFSIGSDSPSESFAAVVTV